MALSPSIVYALPLTLLTFGTILTGPDLAAQDDGDQAAVLADSRVLRCLKTLEKSNNYAFEGAMLAGASPLGIMVMGAAGQGKAPKRKPTLIQGVRNGSLLCWTRQDGKEVLANLGSRWVQKDREGHWIPARGPQGSWKNLEFNDPRFLAERLRELVPKTEWQLLSGVTLDEQPVRCYEGNLTGKNATLLFRSGALPAGGSTGGLGQIIMIQRMVGRQMRMPETLRDVHLKIFEDPRTHLPLKIEVEVFAKQDPNAQVRIAFGGPGAAQDDEEEDEDGEKKPKPTYTYTLSFSKVGKATTPELNAKARGLLGVKPAATTNEAKQGKPQSVKRKG